MSAVKGDKLIVTGGRWVKRILTVDEYRSDINTYFGTVIDHRSKVRRVFVRADNTTPLRECAHTPNGVCAECEEYYR